MLPWLMPDNPGVKSKLHYTSTLPWRELLYHPVSSRKRGSHGRVYIYSVHSEDTGSERRNKYISVSSKNLSSVCFISLFPAFFVGIFVGHAVSVNPAWPHHHSLTVYPPVIMFLFIHLIHRHRRNFDFRGGDTCGLNGVYCSLCWLTGCM